MLTTQRHRFSLPEGLHYLNAAYMGPLSRATQEAGFEGIRRKADPSTIASEDFFTESDALRRLFARLVNAPDPSSIAIVPAVSYALSFVARALEPDVRAGQSIVVAEAQFPSNVYPWRRLARRRGLQLRTVAAPPGPARGAAWNERLLEAIDADTAVVALPPLHWTDGTLFDLERLGERAREVGATFVVDGTQSVGALPFDVGRLRPDALVVAGYKWLLGPYSLGCAYLGPRLAAAEPLEETWTGRLGAEDFAGLVNYRDEYQPGAVRHDVGERSNFILVPMLAAALREILEWGPAAIQAYCRTLAAPLVDAARERGFHVEADDARAGHLFGLRAPAGLDLDRLHARLRERRIHVSRRGNALRISPHVYNDEGDIAALIAALREAR
ncbi:MAG: aminotransferase class V-fold PLP-dependent enzyme [Gemmatimonadetes bacterium]|nr:aminotransferase class V-fold PLP-dependent enzyme [Gemmatimonadota bacterium]